MRALSRLGPPLCAGLLVLLAGALDAAEPPRVDLTELFADRAAWAQAAAELEAAITRFASLRESEWRDADALLEALAAKDEVHRRAAVVDGYLGLRQALDRDDAEAAALRPRMDELSALWERSSAWFDERLRATPGAKLKSWRAERPELAVYGWLLERARAEAPRPPSARERELLALAEEERRTLREVYSALAVREAPRVSVELAAGGRLEITPAGARNFGAELADPRDRRAAQRAWLEALGERSATYAALLGGVVRREAFEARQLGWPSPLAARLADERIPPAAVDALLAAAGAAGPAVGRYHAARRARLGLERYGTRDVRVPIGGARADWSWDEARGALLEAAAPLGEEYLAYLRRAFEEGWIDAVERPGKNPFGFSTFVYGDHPYASVVFRGATVDLFRLAHELGHAVHHQIAYERRPFAVARPSTLVGEAVAAVHELLLARHLAADAAQAATVADLEGQTILRLFVATALDADFERAAHEGGAELGAARLGELYVERLRDFHGGALDLEPWDRFGWMETPHFLRDPFYMPRYGLAFAAGAAIVEQLESSEPGRGEAARHRFFELLAAGAEAAPIELLARAGADLERPESIAAIARRLERIAAELAGGSPGPETAGGLERRRDRGEGGAAR